jgi:hypothetical protein
MISTDKVGESVFYGTINQETKERCYGRFKHN